MKKLRTGLSVACVVSVAAMIGCQAPPPVAPGADEATLNRGGGRVAGPAAPGGQAGMLPGAQAGAQGGPGGQAGSAGDVGAAAGGATGTGGAAALPGGAGVAGAGIAGGPLPKARVAGTPDREAVLALARVMSVEAKAGGQYVSPDGSLQATIPPGALSADARVRFMALDTSDLPANVVMTPGIMFAMDLGGAALKDGQVIMVKSRVDPRFVEEFNASAPGKDPASAGLSQDANGVWYLTMPVKAIAGPNAEHMQANQVDGSLATVEMQPAPATYGLKQAAAADPSPSPSASPTPAPTPEPTPVPTPTPVPKLPTTPSGDAEVDGWSAMTQAEKDLPQHRRVDAMVVRARGHDVTLQMRDTRAATLGTADKSEYIQCFIGHGWCASGTIYDTIDGTIKFNKGVGTNHLPPVGLTQAVNFKRSGGNPARMDWDCGVTQQVVDVSVQARYTSDDPDVDGKPANDATITRVAGGATMSNGPQADLTFPMGLGVSFDVYGSINRPEYSQSDRVRVTASQGLAPVRLAIPKNSPQITLNIQADAPLKGATFNVEFTVGTEKRTATIDMPSEAGENSSGGFRVRVPDDNDHTLTLRRVSSANFSDVGGSPINVGFPVHRNGTYVKTVTVKLNAAK